MTPSANNPVKTTAYLLPVLLASALALTGCGAKKAATKPVASSKSAASKPAEPAAPPAPTPEEVQGKSPEERFDAALKAMRGKQNDEARALFAALAKDQPQLSGPLTNLGILDARAGKREQAIGDFARAVQANPDNALAYNWLGMLYRQSKAYPDAEAAYKKALAIKPGYHQAMMNLAVLYDVYLNHPVDALVQYRAYAEATGNKDLKVTAWIKDLEQRTADAEPAKALTPAAVAPPKPASAVRPAAAVSK